MFEIVTEISQVVIDFVIALGLFCTLSKIVGAFFFSDT
jgi:hypothetical protein